ncbi:MAG: tRNA dihydrouridine synthase DusB [Anaerovoracaceae bacterium]
MERNKKKEYRIGSVVLENPFLLAPLAGITDSPFRRLCKEQGAALVYSEMVSAKGLYYDGKKTESLLSYHTEEAPIAYQLFGSEPDIMAWAVEKLSDRGNCMIDVNMGCPVPKVAKNGEGAALMKDPELAVSVATAMIRSERQVAVREGRQPKPITVKCRLGWDQSRINLREFGLKMQEAGISALAVHARTREQMYSGKADWNAIAEVKAALSIPVIGSGDIFTGADANRMLEETGCDFVMIARGALGNPWIFRDALSIYNGCPLPAVAPAEEKAVTILRHMDLQVKEKGPSRAVQEMRKHVGWYLKGTPGAAELRRKVNQAATVTDLRDVIKELYDRENLTI